MFWVISVYFNIRNTLPKSGTFLLGHPVYKTLQKAALRVCENMSSVGSAVWISEGEWGAIWPLKICVKNFVSIFYSNSFI